MTWIDLLDSWIQQNPNAAFVIVGLAALVIVATWMQLVDYGIDIMMEKGKKRHDSEM